jgi:fatty acid desaturase
MFTSQPIGRPSVSSAVSRGRRAAESARNPRESMANLPGFMQPFLTWLTGMPLPGQTPLLRWTPWRLVICTAGEILLGLLVGVVALYYLSWISILLLPLSWLLTTGGVRMLFVVIEHCCTHHIFSPKRRVNKAVAEAISVLFWTQHYSEFKHEHATHHRLTRLAGDPDTEFLNEWGFFAGMPRGAVLRRLVATLLSPRYHVTNFIERLQYSISGSKYKLVASPLWILLMLSAVAYFDLWLYFVILWLMPMTVLFQASMLINILTEHRWPSPDNTGKRDLEEVCFGRFCGESVPVTAGQPLFSKIWLWAKWWARLVFVYLPYRLFVLVGDEGQHDLHHRQPTSDWVNAKFSRYAEVSTSRIDKYGEYTDEWGSLLDHIYACSIERSVSTAKSLSA